MKKLGDIIQLILNQRETQKTSSSIDDYHYGQYLLWPFILDERSGGKKMGHSKYIGRNDHRWAPQFMSSSSIHLVFFVLAFIHFFISFGRLLSFSCCLSLSLKRKGEKKKETNGQIQRNGKENARKTKCWKLVADDETFLSDSWTSLSQKGFIARLSWLSVYLFRLISLKEAKRKNKPQ